LDKVGLAPVEYPGSERIEGDAGEAYRIFARRERLSLKHRWICFRDDKHYYIPDAFGKSIAARKAFKYGVKVNGNTGALDWQVRPYRCSTQK